MQTRFPTFAPANSKRLKLARCCHANLVQSSYAPARLQAGGVLVPCGCWRWKSPAARLKSATIFRLAHWAYGRLKNTGPIHRAVRLGKRLGILHDFPLRFHRHLPPSQSVCVLHRKDIPYRPKRKTPAESEPKILLRPVAA